MENCEKLKDLLAKIESTESQLNAYYADFRQLTNKTYESNLTIENVRGSQQWKWTIYLCLGYAFISCMVYLLGIAKHGRNSDVGIPEFFFKVDIAYFAILNFYVLFMVLVPQMKYFKDYQVWTIFFGFWCCHWLIYDWWWWAYEYGIGRIIDPSAFWIEPFYSPLLMPNPPMYLFLIEAILGAIMGFYTFFIPRNGKQLAPTLLWLYTVYLNASVSMMLGIEMPWILIIGIIIIIFAFSLAIFNTLNFFRHGTSNIEIKEVSTTLESLFVDNPESLIAKIIQFDILKKPWSIILILLFGIMYLFLMINPAIGLYLGMTIWYLIPLFYLVKRSLISIVLKHKNGKQEN